MKKQRGFALAELVIVIVGLLLAGGWIANIVKLVGMDFAKETGMFVVRVIGVLVAPLGGVLGFF